jgi:hypothetical protein
MRRAALPLLLALSLVACKKKPDPAELAAAASASAVAPGAAAAAAGSGASLLSGFEGRVKLAVKGRLGGGQDKPMALDLGILVKNGKLRADVPPGIAPGPDAGPVYVIVEAEAKKVYAVMESKKQALLIDLEKLAAQLEAMGKGLPTGHAGGAGSGAAPPSGSMTGKTEKVAGYTCEIWEVKQEGRRAELCVMKDEKAWLKFPETALPPQLSWAKQLTDGRHVPLRYVAFGPDGKETGRVEVTSVEKTTLPASDFEVPKGFVIASFDQMMAGLGGLMGGGPGGPSGMKGLPPGFKLPPGMVLPSGLPPRAKPNATGGSAP